MGSHGRSKCTAATTQCQRLCTCAANTNAFDPPRACRAGVFPRSPVSQVVGGVRNKFCESPPGTSCLERREDSRPQRHPTRRDDSVRAPGTCTLWVVCGATQLQGTLRCLTLPTGWMGSSAPSDSDNSGYRSRHRVWCVSVCRTFMCDFVAVPMSPRVCVIAAGWVGGWVGVAAWTGMNLPVSTTNVSNPVVATRLARWDTSKSHRRAWAPHIKTYCMTRSSSTTSQHHGAATGDGVVPCSLDFVVMGSHNMSIPAWGRLCTAKVRDHCVCLSRCRYCAVWASAAMLHAPLFLD